MSPAPARCAPLVALALLASCGAHSPSGNNPAGEAPTRVVSKLRLVSNAFGNGEPIPVEYTCDGRDQAPLLSWQGTPQGTKSFAVTMQDPDAPGGPFDHWGIFNIPASTRSVGGGHESGSEAINGFDKAGYGGPCPPKGHGPHHYRFMLFALDISRLDLPAHIKVADVEAAAKKHAIGQGELIGTYERK